MMPRTQFKREFFSAPMSTSSLIERARFSTWLARIATNAALMKIRKNRASREVGVEDPADVVELSVTLCQIQSRFAQETEQKAALKHAIAKLRPTLRNVVELYDLQERSLHETAQALGISPRGNERATVSCTSRATSDCKTESRRSVELVRLASVPGLGTIRAKNFFLRRSSAAAFTP